MNAKLLLNGNSYVARMRFILTKIKKNESFQEKVKEQFVHVNHLMC